MGRVEPGGVCSFRHGQMRSVARLARGRSGIDASVLRVAACPQGFHSPLASELLLFAWPLRRRSGANSAAGPQGGGQEPGVRERRHCAAGAARTAQPARRAEGRSPESREGQPTLAPCAQSLCSRCASPLRGSLTVHPWTGIELAHLLWATLRAFPAQPRRERRDPLSAHRARQSNSPSSAFGTFSRLAGEGGSTANTKACTCRKLLRLGCAGCAVNGAPMQWRSGAGKARRVGAMDCAQLAASTWMCCQPTPGAAARSRRTGVRRPLRRGGLLFGYFLLATQEKVTRSPKASESSAPKDAPRSDVKFNNVPVTGTLHSQGRRSGPFAKLIFASASCLRSPAYAGTTIPSALTRPLPRTWRIEQPGR
jgi:hypothetical protein